MRIHYSKEADALYIRLNENEITDSQEISDNVIMDYSADGSLVAIEILRASRNANIKELIIQAFEKVMVEKEAVG